MCRARLGRPAAAYGSGRTPALPSVTCGFRWRGAWRKAHSDGPRPTAGGGRTGLVGGGRTRPYPFQPNRTVGYARQVTDRTPSAPAGVRSAHTVRGPGAGVRPVRRRPPGPRHDGARTGRRPAAERPAPDDPQVGACSAARHGHRTGPYGDGPERPAEPRTAPLHRRKPRTRTGGGLRHSGRNRLRTGRGTDHLRTARHGRFPDRRDEGDRGSPLPLSPPVHGAPPPPAARTRGGRTGGGRARRAARTGDDRRPRTTRTGNGRGAGRGPPGRRTDEAEEVHKPHSTRTSPLRGDSCPISGRFLA